ncbi:Na+/H+ antiporter NhaA [Pseudomonas sp. COR18]|uniref:Na+/H+ antiporter NhaA n=1 Tax=Pseudomonas sp. COR18 TaxID=3399680 RepID=UPI003B00B486
MPAPNTPASHSIPRVQQLTQQALAAIERFSHIEAVSGIVLLIAAIVALLWANLPTSVGYEAFWHARLSISLGSFSAGATLHYLVNDGLMTIFFLVVGMEIRSEMKDGSLSNMRMATLPVMAALGGVAVPALVYVFFNAGHASISGWAVPTATDIAFAVGVLALLGKTIPSGVRVFLLALAIIDDIVAVLIIALFYTSSLNPLGAVVALAGILAVLLFQRMGIANAWLYLIPGAILWAGFAILGVHPTLAGVVLGLMTPVYSRPATERPLATLSQAIRELVVHVSERPDHDAVHQPLARIRQAHRELLAPVKRVQVALHPWVAYGIMPLFALANAGVEMGHLSLDSGSTQAVMIGVFLALVLGKPLGVVLSCLVLVKTRLCQLPEGVEWRGVVLIGLLAGIGFTMSIFIAGLAYTDQSLLGIAKLGVLSASGCAALLGLLWGLGAFVFRPSSASR